MLWKCLLIWQHHQLKVRTSLFNRTHQKLYTSKNEKLLQKILHKKKKYAYAITDTPKHLSKMVTELIHGFSTDDAHFKRTTSGRMYYV